MKRIVALVITILLMVGCFASCSADSNKSEGINGKNSEETMSSDEKSTEADEEEEEKTTEAEEEKSKVEKDDEGEVLYNQRGEYMPTKYFNIYGNNQEVIAHDEIPIEPTKKQFDFYNFVKNEDNQTVNIVASMIPAVCKIAKKSFPDQKILLADMVIASKQYSTDNYAEMYFTFIGKREGKYEGLSFKAEYDREKNLKVEMIDEINPIRIGRDTMFRVSDHKLDEIIREQGVYSASDTQFADFNNVIELEPTGDFKSSKLYKNFENADFTTNLQDVNEAYCSAVLSINALIGKNLYDKTPGYEEPWDLGKVEGMKISEVYIGRSIPGSYLIYIFGNYDVCLEGYFQNQETGEIHEGIRENLSYTFIKTADDILQAYLAYPEKGLYKLDNDILDDAIEDPRITFGELDQ